MYTRARGTTSLVWIIRHSLFEGCGWLWDIIGRCFEFAAHACTMNEISGYGILYGHSLIFLLTSLTCTYDHSFMQHRARLTKHSRQFFLCSDTLLRFSGVLRRLLLALAFAAGERPKPETNESVKTLRQIDWLSFLPQLPLHRRPKGDYTFS